MAGGRLSGTISREHQRSSQLLSPKHRDLTVENPLRSDLGFSLSHPMSPSPAPLPFGVSCRATSTSLPDSTPCSSPPPISP